MIETLKERFESKYIKGGEDECWLWLDELNKYNQGRIYISGGNGTPMIREIDSRQAYKFAYGEISNDLQVLHTCDRPDCVNPKHLFLGTQKDNMNDMCKKGRHKEQLKTHCPNGHKYSKENTSISSTTGGRICKQCSRDRYIVGARLFSIPKVLR